MTAGQPLDEVTRWRRTAPGQFEGHPDATWLQGKGMFGGMLAAAILRGMDQTLQDDARVPRSLTVHYCAPVRAMPTQLNATVERTGMRVAHLSARVVQEGKPACLASAVFAVGRDVGPAYQDDVMPAVSPFEETDPVPVDTPMMPTFTKHFEFRFCGGQPPFSGAPEAFMAAWVRPRVPQVLDATLMAALLDVMPPAFFARMEAPALGATVDLTMAFFDRFPRADAAAGEPHLCTVRSRWARGGYAEQLNQVWHRDGTLLGQCRQMVALLG